MADLLEPLKAALADRYRDATPGRSGAMMPTEQRMCDRKPCAKPTAHLVQKRSHILHLLLSILTVGVWIPIWITLVIG
jgi:hypothetical protein